MNPSSEREAPSDQAFEIVSAWLREQKEVANGTMLHRMCQFADFVIARAALSTQPQQARWMPIETAPKDGTTLLLAGKKNRMADGDWHSAAKAWNWPYVNAEPTHWMPLPLPPVPGQEGGGV